MMHERAAMALAEEVGTLLPDHEVTSVPWEDPEVHPRSEWVVTIWQDGEVLLDVFLVGEVYVARRVNLGPEVGRAHNAHGIAAMARRASA